MSIGADQSKCKAKRLDLEALYSGISSLGLKLEASGCRLGLG